MFEKFGEMDYEELLRTAAAKRDEGDEVALIALAEENGLDREDAEDYMDGADVLCTPFQAASAKLWMEKKELGLDDVLGDWTELIVELAMESAEDDFSIAIRRKDRSLKECMARIIQYAFEHKVQMPDAILDVTKVTHNGRMEKMRKPLYLGTPCRADVKRIARAYYLEGRKNKRHERG